MSSGAAVAVGKRLVRDYERGLSTKGETISRFIEAVIEHSPANRE